MFQIPKPRLGLPGGGMSPTVRAFDFSPPAHMQIPSPMPLGVQSPKMGGALRSGGALGSAVIPMHVQSWLRSRDQQGLGPVWDTSGRLVAPRGGALSGASQRLSNLRRRRRFLEDEDDDLKQAERALAMSGDPLLKSVGRGVGNIGRGVTAGATLGSAVPLVGSAVGATIGGLAGAAASAPEIIQAAGQKSETLQRGLAKLGFGEDPDARKQRLKDEKAEKFRRLRREERIEEEELRHERNLELRKALGVLRASRAARPRRRRGTGLRTIRRRGGRPQVIIP